MNRRRSPLLVEGVSESTKSTDYRAKRAKYSVLDSPEYWICDPLKEVVTVCMLLEGWYQAAKGSGKAVIESPTFSALELAVERILWGDQLQFAWWFLEEWSIAPKAIIDARCASVRPCAPVIFVPS